MIHSNVLFHLTDTVSPPQHARNRPSPNCQQNVLKRAQLSRGNVHCFVDFSNFWYGLTNRLKDTGNNNELHPSTPAYITRCQQTFANLNKVLVGGFDEQRIRSRIAVGSVLSSNNEQLWDQLRSEGFRVNLFARAKNGHEVANDCALHAQILAQIANPIRNPAASLPTLILLTGDGNDNVGGGGVKDNFEETTNFPNCVQAALDCKWLVIQYCWSWSCSAAYKKIIQTHPHRRNYQLVYLDDTALPFCSQFSCLAPVKLPPKHQVAVFRPAKNNPGVLPRVKKYHGASVKPAEAHFLCLVLLLLSVLIAVGIWNHGFKRIPQM